MADDELSKGVEPDGEPLVMPVHITESQTFRTVHVNGAMGGVTGLGEMYLAVFSERAKHPSRLDMKVFPNGNTEVDAQHFSKDRGLTRELEVGLFMSPAAAWELARFILKALRESGLLVETRADGPLEGEDASTS